MKHRLVPFNDNSNDVESIVKVVEYAEAIGCQFCEVRAIRTQVSEFPDQKRHFSMGYNLRLLFNNRLIFKPTGDKMPSSDSVDRAIRKAASTHRNAKAFFLHGLPARRYNYSSLPPGYNWSDEQKLELIQDAQNMIPQNANYELKLFEETTATTYANSEGSIGGSLVCRLSALFHGRNEETFPINLESSDYQFLFTKRYQEIVHNLVRNPKLERTRLKAGFHNVYLNSECASIVFHELAHLFEADFYLRNRIDQSRSILPSDLTIRDVQGSSDHYWHIPYDHEGVPKTNVDLVMKGEVTGQLLHSRQSAAYFHCDPTGNSFSYDPAKRQTIRQCFIVVDAGEYVKEQLMENSTLHIDFLREERPAVIVGDVIKLRVNKARIMHGKVSYQTGNFEINLNLRELLKSMKIADDQTSFVIKCGKFSSVVPVGISCPSISFKVKITSYL